MFIGNERQLLFIITRLQMKMLGQKMGLTVELNFFAFNGLNTEGIKKWRYKQRVVRKFDDKKVTDFKIKLNTNSIDCRVLESYFRPNADFLSGLTPLILGFLQRFTAFKKIKNQTEMVINWTGHIMHE